MIVFMLMTLPIPGSEDILDLASTGDGIGYPASITRRTGNGSSLWTVLPPEGSRQDAWVAVRIEGPRVIATLGLATWSTSTSIPEERSSGR